MADDYHSHFVDEAQTQITELENALLDLEDNPDDDEAMEAIFRVAHTLKGNAGAMEFDKTSSLAHAIEDILDEIRDGNLEAEGNVIDLLFDGLDLLEQHVDEIRETGDVQTDPEETVALLRDYIAQDSAGGSGTDIETVDDYEVGEDGTAIDCIAITQEDERCSFDAKDGSNFCHVHQPEDEKEAIPTPATGELTTPENEDVDTLAEQYDGSASTVAHVSIKPSDDAVELVEEGEMSPVEALNDAFTVLVTEPSDSDLRDAPERPFSALIENTIGEDNINAAMEGVETVNNALVTDVTDDIEWAGGKSATARADDSESSDDAADDDVSVEELLDSASEFDNIDDVDDDMVDDVELGDVDLTEEGAAGTFSAGPDTDGEGGEDESHSHADDDDEFDGDENKGVALFDELQEEVGETTTDWDELQEEAEEIGFEEIQGEGDEVGFDELLDVEAEEEEFDFDDEDMGEAEVSDDELDEIVGDTDTESESDLEPEGEPDVESGDDSEVDTGSDMDFSTESDTGDAGETGAVAEGTTDTGGDDAEDLFDEGFSPDTTDEAEGETPEGDVAGEVTDEDVEEALREVENDDEGVVLTDDDLDTFDTAFDDEDDDAVDFDELLNEAGRESSGKFGEVQSINVDVSQLDDLYSLVQELITSRIRLRRAVEEGRHDEQALIQALNELDDLEKVSSRMQDTVMSIRLVPLQRAVERLPRVARDTARDQEKEVDFTMEGTDVELDRAVLSEIGDPLMHLVKNAVSHGIESPEERQEAGKDPEGTVRLSAERTRDRVIVTVSDDGRGMDADAMREKAVEEGLLTEEEAESLSDRQAYELTFRSGFSTVDEVTESSGRGVGMDVVYNTVQRLDGSVAIESSEGKGTTVRMRLPVSLAIEDMLFVQSGGEEYGIPIKNVDEIGYVHNIEKMEGKEAHIHEGDVYPVIRLGDALETDAEAEGTDGRLIRISGSVRQIALHCDAVGGQEEVVVEPYDGVLNNIPGLSGAAVLGEGNVVNILDVETL